KRRVGPQELCGLFTSFSDAEGKVVKFIETNSRSCGIPPDVLSITKSNHSKTLEKKQQICAAAQFGERRGPGLSEALGMRAVPTPGTTAKGGAFDPRRGSPLAKWADRPGGSRIPPGTGSIDSPRILPGPTVD